MNLNVLLAACAFYLTACATALSVQPVRLPKLEPVPLDVLEESFIVQIQNFLSGSLKEQTPSDSP